MRLALKFAFFLSGTSIVALVAIPPRASFAHNDEATKLFRIQCSTCHGVDGRGRTTIGKQFGMKDWKDGKTLKALSDAQIRRILLEGVKGSDGKERMPSFKKLTDEQVGTLLQHVRSLQ